MDLHFKPITEENRKFAEQLKKAPGQEGYVEDVGECLLEADKRRCWKPVGIYDGDLLIGFAMYGFFWEYLPFGRVWLDRLLIDAKYQGRGYGKAALYALIEEIEKEYRRRTIYLSVIEGNNAAIKMYQNAGFRFNGKLDIHGEKVMVYSNKNTAAILANDR